MARAIHTDGTDPHKEPRVIHCCNMCERDLTKIRLPALTFWKPQFGRERKYPLRYGAFLCEEHKTEMGFDAHSYVAVPRAEGQSTISALKDYLNLLEESSS